MPATNVWNKILRGFEVQLATIASSTPIASPNVDYTPVVGTSFIRSTLLPAQTLQASIGIDGTNRYQGVYQVDVFSPQGTGPAAGIALVDEIIELFPRGLSLSTDDITVRVATSSVLPAREEPDWYQIPVSIDWFSTSCS